MRLQEEKELRLAAAEPEALPPVREVRGQEVLIIQEAGRQARRPAGAVMIESLRFLTAETQRRKETLLRITFGLLLWEWY